MSDKNNNNSFVKGALVLGTAAIIVKILGAFFRIPLGNFLGDEGIGYYQAAYPLYASLVVVATAGLPAAIAKMVSERVAVGNRIGANRVFKVSFILLFILGIITSTALFFGAGFISELIQNPNAYYSMIALAPALFFVSLMAAFRGYFQGLQNMFPTAISQIIESFGRFVIGLYLAFSLAKISMPKAAAGGTFGATAGAFFGCIIITYLYFKNKKKLNLTNTSNHKEESVKSILKHLMMIAIPITIGASVLPLMNLIDAGIVIRRLSEIGYTYELANKLFGRLGLGNNIINLPQAITGAMQVSLVPAIAYLMARKDMNNIRKNASASIKITLLIALPSAVGLALLSQDIMLLLYPAKVEAAIGAGEILKISAWGIIFLSLFQSTTGILQGLGKQLLPARNLLIGAALKLVLSYTLIGMPSINIKGAAISSVSGFMLACILNIMSVIKFTGLKVSIVDEILKPIIAVVTMGIGVVMSRMVLVNIIGSRLTTVVSIGIGAILFFIMVFALKIISDDDLKLMPGGSKIKRLSNKLHKRR